MFVWLLEGAQRGEALPRAWNLYFREQPQRDFPKDACLALRRRCDDGRTGGHRGADGRPFGASRVGNGRAGKHGDRASPICKKCYGRARAGASSTSYYGSSRSSGRANIECVSRKDSLLAKI